MHLTKVNAICMHKLQLSTLKTDSALLLLYHQLFNCAPIAAWVCHFQHVSSGGKVFDRIAQHMLKHMG